MSLDEAYLDVTEAAAERSPIAIAIDIKERVSAETGLTVSVGLGSGKTVAKIASDLQKPDGLVVVPTGQEADFLAPLAVGKLVGVGPKSAARLHDEGVDTIGQLAAMPEAWFARHFGKRGDSIRNRARGIDHDPVQTSREAKSISAETTFAEDLPGNSEDERAELRAIVERLSGRVARSLPGKGLVGRTVTVKLRLSDFTTFTRQTTLPSPTDDEAAIVSTAWMLLERELAPDRAFRLLGVGVSGFSQKEGPDETPEPVVAQQRLIL